MKLDRIIEKQREKIFSSGFCQRNKTSEKDFTRQRVFGFGRLVLFQVNLATKSLSVELTRFFHRIKYNVEEKSFTKQSYSEARMKMKHEAYKELNEDLVKEYYTDDDYKKYKGYRLIAIDGSRIGLPNNKEVIKEFGIAENNGKSIPMAMNSTGYDVLNNIVINTYLEKYETSEQKLAEVQLEKIKKLTTVQSKDIIIMDRGYRSVYLFTKMLILGYDFVVRCTAEGFIKEVTEASKSDQADSIIEIKLTEKTRKNNEELQKLICPSGIKEIKLRLIRVRLDNGAVEYLITSLMDKEFSLSDFKEIYHLRWNEEVYFNFQKNILEIENFSGRNPETIRQDYFARVLSSNLSSLIIEEAQKEIDNEETENKKHKYDKYKINKSVAIGILKDEVIKILFSPKEIWKKQYRILVKTIKRHRIPVVPGRNFERKFKIANKFFLKKRKVV